MTPQKDKTCIVCGKKFSTRTQKANGAWQDTPHKRTCSQTCSDYWHNKMRWRKGKVAPVKVYKKKQVKVQCKCPFCKVIHYESWDRPPSVIPWPSYCKAHKWCKEADDPELSGMAGSRITRHAGAM